MHKKAVDLLVAYPKAAEVIREWFLEKMLESFKDNTVPESFKELLKQKGIDNENLSRLIDSQPRALYDIFDEHQIYIDIRAILEEEEKSVLKCFRYRIPLQKELVLEDFPNRKEAEIAAINAAFGFLEEKLIDFPMVEADDIKS